VEMALPNTPTARPRRSIEDFRGNFEDLAVFMQRSWEENKSQPLLYTAEFLASCFSYPGSSFSLAPTLYEDSRIVGFVAGFPRRVQYNKKELKIIVTAFLTVASDYKKSGYGIVLWTELVKRARAAGYDGVISYSVDGEPMTNMMLGCYQQMKVPATRIYSVHYLTRLILPKKSGMESEHVDQEFLSSFMQMATRTAAAVPLRRVWSLEEAEWQCLHRSDPMVVSHASQGRRGFLTGYVMEVADRNRTKCLLIDDVLWDDLATEERQVLVQKLVDRSASAGVRMAVVPLLGYADPEPFIKSRFLRSSRLLHAYFGVWSEGSEPEPVSSFYVDVF
jgi:hypothetical protein